MSRFTTQKLMRGLEHLRPPPRLADQRLKHFANGPAPSISEQTRLVRHVIRPTKSCGEPRLLRLSSSRSSVRGNRGQGDRWRPRFHALGLIVDRFPVQLSCVIRDLLHTKKNPKPPDVTLRRIMNSGPLAAGVVLLNAVRCLIQRRSNLQVPKLRAGCWWRAWDGICSTSSLSQPSSAIAMAGHIQTALNGEGEVELVPGKGAEFRASRLALPERPVYECFASES